MIDRYSDHAANERTFLAWIRTAIAVMAFGFLVERFDLFLEIAGQALARRTLSTGGHLAGNVAGLILIGLGAVTIILALVRFRKTAKEIDSPERLPGSGERLDVALAALLVVLGDRVIRLLVLYGGQQSTIGEKKRRKSGHQYSGETS